MAPYDKTLDAAVKAQEKLTGKKAPYFGASSKSEALKLAAWKNIGKAWGDRAPGTCWDVYVAHHGNERQHVSKVVYTATAKAAILSRARDKELKRAAAVCHDSGRNVYGYTHQYMDGGAPMKEVQARLKALSYTHEKDVWLAELHDELDATEDELVDRTITYDVDGSTHKAVKVGFVNTSTEIHVFCVADEKSAEFDAGEEWECSVAHARIWAAGGVVEEPEEMSEDEEEPPAVPDPPKPQPPPRTREGKRAAALSARYAVGARQTNAKRQKKKAADAAADEAEAQDDVEPNDAAYRRWEPSSDFLAGDARALAVNIPERLALLDVERLLDTTTVSTELADGRRRLSVLRDAVDVARSRRHRRAPTRRAPPNYAAFTQDHQPLLAEARAGRGNAAGAPRRAGAHPRRRREVRGRPRRLDAAPRRGLLRAADPPRRPRETRPVPRHGRGDG